MHTKDRQPQRQIIADSWQRVRATGLSPSASLVERPQNETELDSKFMRAANPVLLDLEREFSNSNFGALLANQSAVIVGRYAGDHQVLRRADEVGARVGAEFTEETSGTNAIATPFETREAVFIDGEDHYLESMKRFRCIGMPIYNPLTNRFEGVLDLMTDEDVDAPLLRFAASRVVSKIQKQLMSAMSAETLAASAAFHTIKNRTEDAVILFGEDYVLNNRAALRLFDASDYHNLAAFATDAQAGDGIRNVTLASGRTVDLQVSSVSSSRNKLMRVSLAKSYNAPIPRKAFLRGSDELVEQQIVEARKLPGHVLIAGERGTGRTQVAHRITEGFVSTKFDVSQFLNSQTILDQIKRELQSTASRGLIIVEEANLLETQAQEKLTRIIQANLHTGVRFILTETLEVGDEPTGYLQSLCATHIHLKPLRVLLPEFDMIAQEILTTLSPHRNIRLSVEAIDLMKLHPWQGNFAELQAVLQFALQKQKNNHISVTDLPDRYKIASRKPDRKLSALEVSEQATIRAALERTSGNKVHAAKELGISRSTLYARLRYFGIE